MSDTEAKVAALKEKLVELKKQHPTWKDEPVEVITQTIDELKSIVAEQKKAEKAAKAAAKAAKAAPKATNSEDKNTRGMTVKKSENFNHWYSEVILKAELISHYPISGCYVLRPWAYRVWECIQDFMNAEFRKLEVENCYFPIFVTEAALTKEQDHLEGFAAEVAWITKSGKSELNEKIAIRPTSETVMYPVFAEWIRSHRELPMRLNQWCNVVRWEFKNPTPFLRTREFLWQEGHTVHANEKSASDEVYDILDIYARTYAELLAVPMVKGIKTEKEKFAGGDFTTTVEGYIPYAGRGIQAATSHGLGQNFAKMFDIRFEDESGSHAMPYQNSWGFTTRSIGIAVMVHGDDQGLIMPPRAAPKQVVIIPIIFKDGQTENIYAEINAVAKELTKAGIRVQVDLNDTHNSGYKRNHWELKGVPIRLELGPKDLAANAVLMCSRDNRKKVSVPRASLVDAIRAEIDAMHDRLLAKATAERDSNIAKITDWKDFVPALNARKIILAPFCTTNECEEDIKKASKGDAATEADVVGENGEVFEAITASAKALCYPLEQDPLQEGDKCFRCGAKAVKRCLFGRSF